MVTFVQDSPIGQGIDPATFEEMMAGQRAATQLEGLMPQIEQAQALRAAPLPGMVGTQAASPLSFLAGALRRERGGRELRGLQQQQADLQAQQRAGQRAETLAGLQQKDYRDLLRQQELEDKQRQQFEMMQGRYGEIAERDVKLAEQREALARTKEELRRARIKESVQPWVSVDDPTDIENIGFTQGGKSVDEQGNEASTAGRIPLSEYNKRQSIEASLGLNASKMTGKQKNTISSAYAGVEQIDKIHDIAKTFDSGDIEFMQQPFMNTVMNKLTPSDFKQWRKEGLSTASPRVRAYMAQLERFVSDVRNNLFGATLTANEINIANMWSPSAEGLSLDERIARTNSMKDVLAGSVRGIDKQYGTDYASRIAPTPPMTREQVGTEADGQPTRGFSDPAKERRYQELKAKLGK